MSYPISDWTQAAAGLEAPSDSKFNWLQSEGNSIHVVSLGEFLSIESNARRLRQVFIESDMDIIDSDTTLPVYNCTLSRTYSPKFLSVVKPILK